MTDAIATVADHMQTELVTLGAGMEIIHAITLLLDTGVSGACVLDDEGQLVGFLSKRDGLKAALNAAYYKEWGGTVADLMSREVETLDAGLDLVSAAERFVASSYRRFPVLEDGRLVGQISRTDVLRALSRQWR
ncbi:CBS domain-containing protein [Pseudogemmobacter sonorensis]|uniref:CBS domain-containing protein n=1 Tax=Pseudogemmobacter sonorensis TaxID=2989681 RepID=UPI0036CB204E